MRATVQAAGDVFPPTNQDTGIRPTSRRTSLEASRSLGSVRQPLLGRERKELIDGKQGESVGRGGIGKGVTADLKRTAVSGGRSSRHGFDDSGRLSLTGRSAIITSRGP